MGTAQVRPPRMYEELWKKIKTTPSHKVSVLVHPNKVATVKRCLSKEKHHDLGFKVVNELENFYLRYSYDSKKNILTCELCSKLGLMEIKVA